jgi:hypothetical protein
LHELGMEAEGDAANPNVGKYLQVGWEDLAG